MRVKYHYSVDDSEERRRILEERGVKYSVLSELKLSTPGLIYKPSSRRSLVFDIFSDNPFYKEIYEKVVLTDGHYLETFKIEYSRSELKSSEWLLMDSKCARVFTDDDNYTFEYSCLMPFGDNDFRYNHKNQIREYVLKKKINWKPNNNFYSDYDFSKIFCSEYAKRILAESIRGIGFKSVLSKKQEPYDWIYQLDFENTLPHEAVEYREGTVTQNCEICGRKQYIIPIKPENEIRFIRSSYLSGGTDAFVSEDVVGEGWGHHLIVVSQKVYKTVVEDMHERNLRFAPVKLV